MQFTLSRSSLLFPQFRTNSRQQNKIQLYDITGCDFHPSDPFCHYFVPLCLQSPEISSMGSKLCLNCTTGTSTALCLPYAPFMLQLLSVCVTTSFPLSISYGPQSSTCPTASHIPISMPCRAGNTHESANCQCLSKW